MSMLNKYDLLLGKLCIAKKIISKEQLKQCSKVQEQEDLPLGLILLNKRLIGADMLQSVIEQHQKNITLNDSRERGEDLALVRALLHKKTLPRKALFDLLYEQKNMEKHGKKISLAEFLLQSRLVSLTGFLEIMHQLPKETFQCHGCEKEFRLSTLEPGKRVKCKYCKTILQVPSLEQEIAAYDEKNQEEIKLSEREVFAGYQILEVVAEGGMGIIYRAQKESSGKIVALKVLKEAASSPPDIKERFAQEAKTLSRLSHPNIVSILEAGIQDKIPYFTMDFIKGEPLSKIIEQGALPLERALRILTKICHAMEYAHQQGVIHRDLKPSNILIRSDDEPQIIDFGLAKCVDSITAIPTKTGSTLGTLCYMSPEQAKGKLGLVGPRSDIYSLGVILYEMLTGKNPFVGESVFEVYQKILSVEPEAPSRYNAKIKGELDNICLKCLRKDSFQRYKSSELLLQDLENMEKTKHGFFQKIKSLFGVKS